MIVHRSIKRESVCKANTRGNTSGNCFVFSYEITFRYFNIAPSVTCKYEARNRQGILFWKFLTCSPQNFHRNTEETMSVWYFLEYLATYKTAEAVVWTCSVKKEFLKFCKIHKKTPVPESTLLKKETLAQVLSSEFWEFLSTPFLI